MRICLIAGLLTLHSASSVSGADTPAAEMTRTKLFKSKITVDYKDTALREVLKEFAAQADMQNERIVLWTYAPDVKAGQLITYACDEKPLDQAMDDVCKLAGIGYIIVSKDEHKHDGWVRITTGSERGTGKYPDADTTTAKTPEPDPTDPDEIKAASRLKAAKTLIGLNQAADAKAVLQLVIDKHPKSKAAAEAKILLEQLNK